MPEIIGGMSIVEYEMTRSWGLEPASASGRAVGEPTFGVGSYVVYSFGGATFYGIVTSLRETRDLASGKEFSFGLVDNRIRLKWQLIFGAWNQPERRGEVHQRVLPEPPAGEFTVGGQTGADGADMNAGVGSPVPPTMGGYLSGGRDRGRVYAHVVPSQWALQMRCYTAAAVSAADILRSAGKGSLGGFGFGWNFHAAQSKAVMDVSANSGMPLSGLIQQIMDSQGLDVVLDGARTLRFERKGAGSLVIPEPSTGTHLEEYGTALNARPTKVRVVGDRILVQCNNIALEADWRSGWEAFLSEPAWLAEVATRWGVSEATPGGRAEVAALSREVTVGQYVAKLGGAPGGAFADFGRWESASRMAMPCWAYLNEIVFRSYRIPESAELFGVKLRALEVHDGLLCACEIHGTGGGTVIRYRRAQVEFYPEATAFVIARGQPLDLLQFLDREEVVRLRTKDLRNEWSEIGDFTVDAARHAIRFSTAVFLDGNPALGQSILLYPNRGEGGYVEATGLAAGDEYDSIVVPNANYVISPAEVKVSLVFRMGYYHKDFGTGQRWDVRQATNVSPHLLYGPGDGITDARLKNFAGFLGTPTNPGNLAEITYEDGKQADDLAADEAESLIARKSVETSGSYMRHGTAGTSLTGVIDRVTLRLTRDAGLTERVDFEKPVRRRGGSADPGDFARRERMEHLFSGHAELRREVAQLRAIAKLERQAEPPRRKPGYSTSGMTTEMFRKPAGAEDVHAKTYADPDGAAP